MKSKMDDNNKLQNMGKLSWPNLRYYPHLLEGTEKKTIQNLCLKSRYPSHVTGITAQANVPRTNIGVNDLCLNNKNGQT
jgi:hypothetical protein